MPAADRTRTFLRRRRNYLIAAGAGLALFLLVAVLMRAGAFDGLNRHAVDLFAAHRKEFLTKVARGADLLDTWWLLILLIAALVGGLWWSGRMVQAIYVGITIGAAFVINPLLKRVFAVQPPDVHVYVAAFYAFPSGHTTATTAICTSIAVVFWPSRWRWPVVAVAAILSVGMAVSRVYIAAHWPSDVIGGLAVGFTIAMTVRAFMPWPTPQEAEAAREELAEEAAATEPRTTVPATSAEPGPAGGIDVVFLDWGNTLMVDNGMREGPMKDWETVEAEPGAQEALLRLRARYRLVVATNAADSPAYFVRLALARVGLDDYIHDVISSADVGDHKPNYAFFRAALLQEGERGIPLDPRRAVMVGDGTTNDIAGAQRAGMRTIWYNPTKRAFPDGVQPPDVVIRKLADLPAAVDRLAGVQPEKRSRKQRKEDAAAAAAAAGAAAARDLRAAAAAEDSAASAAAALPDAGDGGTETAAVPSDEQPAAAPQAGQPPAAATDETTEAGEHIDAPAAPTDGR